MAVVPLVSDFANTPTYVEPATRKCVRQLMELSELIELDLQTSRVQLMMCVIVRVHI